MRQIFAVSIIIVATILSVTSCSRRPSYVLSEDEMISVLYDIRLAQTIPLSQNQFESYEKRDAIVNGVLEKHSITQADLDSSLVWYVENPKIFQEINDSVLSKIRFEKQALQEKISIINRAKKQKRDRLLPIYTTLNNSNNLLSFRLDSTQIKDSNKFKLSFDVQGLSVSNDSILKAGIYYTYKDTVIHDIAYLNDNKYYQFNKPSLPDSLLKEISGYIYLDKSPVPTSILLYNINYQDSIRASKK